MRHNQLEKELQLMLLMTENRHYTVEQLCDRIQISRRNLYYYIDFFRDAGFVVEKHGTYYSLDKSSPFFTKLFKSVSITEDEAITIRRILDKVSDNSLQVASLKRKLERLYDLDILNSLATDEERAANVNALYDAMKLKRVAVIHNYSSPNSNTSRARVVEPCMFLNGNNDESWYEITAKASMTPCIAVCLQIYPCLAATSRKSSPCGLTDWHTICLRRNIPSRILISHKTTIPIGFSACPCAVILALVALCWVSTTI